MNLISIVDALRQDIGPYYGLIAIISYIVILGLVIYIHIGLQKKVTYAEKLFVDKIDRLWLLIQLAGKSGEYNVQKFIQEGYRSYVKNWQVIYQHIQTMELDTHIIDKTRDTYQVYKHRQSFARLFSLLPTILTLGLYKILTR